MYRGYFVVVTMRGRRVARLVPVDEIDPLADLRARGVFTNRRTLAVELWDRADILVSSQLVCPEARAWDNALNAAATGRLLANDTG